MDFIIIHPDESRVLRLHTRRTQFTPNICDPDFNLFRVSQLSLSYHPAYVYNCFYDYPAYLQ